MKKILLLAIITLSCLFITACTNLDAPEFVKTEFKLNEKATIDHFDIRLTSQKVQPQYNGVASINGQYIVLTFEIKNNNKTDDTINKNNFHLKKDDNTYPANVISPGTINSKETKEYTVIFDVPKEEDYEILFYSNIVTNNIEFDIEF